MFYLNHGITYTCKSYAEKRNCMKTQNMTEALKKLVDSLRLESIVSIVEVRPNFVKLAALQKFLQENFTHTIVHTGQHYDYELSKAFFECLELRAPDYNMRIGSGTHGYQLREMIKKTEAVLIKKMI